MYWMRVTLSGHTSAGRVLWDRHIAEVVGAELEREWPLLFHSMLSSKNNLRNVPSIDILRVMWQWYYHYYTPFSRQILCSSCPKELWKHCHCHILCPPVKMFQNMIKMKLKKQKEVYRASTISPQDTTGQRHIWIQIKTIFEIVQIIYAMRRLLIILQNLLNTRKKIILLKWAGRPWDVH